MRWMQDSSSRSESGPDALEGIWSDGRTSRLRHVRVWFAAGRLHIAGEDEARDWPCGEVRPSARLGHAPRLLAVPGGGRIEVADGPILDAWFPRPPSRIEATADWLERRRPWIAAAALLTVSLVVASLRWGVPWMAEVIATRLPARVEQASSDQVVRLLGGLGVAPSTLPEARQRVLRAAFARLVAGEPRASQMRLVLVHAPAIGANAFTLPDGRIYLTDGLVALAASDDQVLAVLAHEAGHHVYRHAMRQALEGSSVFLLAGALLGDASGSSMTVSLPAVLLSNGFSRGHEREADRYAFDLLRRRGRSPQAFADILRRLARQAPGADGRAAAYLSTHPPTRERIMAAERAARVP